MIQVLKEKFEGSGEVKGMHFERMLSNKIAYLYKIEDIGGFIHYEVFRRKTSPICLDFENRIYSETDYKEKYPKSRDFGEWAWTYQTYDKALTKFYELFYELQEKENNYENY